MKLTVFWDDLSEPATINDGNIVQNRTISITLTQYLKRHCCPFSAELSNNFQIRISSFILNTHHFRLLIKSQPKRKKTRIKIDSGRNNQVSHYSSFQTHIYGLRVPTNAAFAIFHSDGAENNNNNNNKNPYFITDRFVYFFIVCFYLLFFVIFTFYTQEIYSARFQFRKIFIEFSEWHFVNKGIAWFVPTVYTFSNIILCFFNRLISGKWLFPILGLCSTHVNKRTARIRKTETKQEERADRLANTSASGKERVGGTTTVQ